MLKRLLIGSAVLCSLLVSSLPAVAQSPETAPEAQSPQAPQGEISPTELQKFANAIKKIQAIQEETQQKIMQVIASEGLTPQRFVEILQAQQTSQTQPSEPVEVAVTQEELQKFEQATAKLSEVQQETQTQMEQAVQAEGLETQRFEQIFAAVRQNPTLQQQVQRLIQN